MDDPTSILVIQLKRVGDIVVTTPVLSALRRRFPSARLGFLCERPFVPLVENHPGVDVVEPYESRAAWSSLRRVRAARYDWIFDFQSSPRSAIVCWASGARLTAGYRVPFWGRVYWRSVRRPTGAQSVVEGKFSLVESIAGPLGERPAAQIVLTEPEKQWAMQAMPPQSGVHSDGPVGLVPTHRRASRRWPAGYFAALADGLARDGHEVWLFWGPGERQYVEAIRQKAPPARLIPPTSLRQMAALLQRCRLVITNDNGPMHVAVGAGAPTLTVYGPTDAQSWNPGGPRHHTVQATDVPCLGCNLNECPFGHECMTHVQPEIMLARAREILKSGAFGAVR
ncbi:MAG TPA: glycosyltransferase family 9 protein [Elusimicrobiota bacterium]|nr:glycosyltransferase family 9 protein [Elusimicrobiota bacterium]